jgi:putative ABC transport system ATP-binding protein
VPLAAAGAALVAVTAWAARTTNRRLARAGERALCTLRARAFRHIHALSMAYHAEERRGTLVSRVTSDVETLAQFLRWGGVGWVVDSALMLAALTAMAVYDWRLTLVALAAIAPLPLVLRAVQGRVVAAWDAVRTRVGEFLAAVSESLMGAAVIRADGAEDHAQRRVRAAARRRRRAEVRAGALGALLFPVGELFAALTIAAVLLAGLALGPARGLSTGKLVAFAFLIGIFLEPVAELTELLDLTQTAVAGWRKVLDVLDLPVDVVDPTPGRSLPRGRPLGIELCGVSFAYHDGPTVLHDVSCVIPAGARVALVGLTGSGKTTLAKLLVRLADPTAGAIRVAGIDLREVALASLRRALVMVPQDGILFADTVAANARMGQPDADDAEVAAAFAALGLGEWLDGLPAGLATPVGERGAQLSVGERQLVALARGYLVDPGCLILDEATSAVDPATEVRLRLALERLTAGRTAITIAHRLATPEHADLVLVLEHGRLVEQGRHQDLVAAGGTYGRLHASWLASLAEQPGGVGIAGHGR